MGLPLKYRALRQLGHQHWIRRGRDRFIRIFANPDTMPSTPFQVDFFGSRYSGDLNNFIDWAVYFYGSQSYNELSLLRDIVAALRPTAATLTFVDIGANVGHHTLFMAPLVDRVFAFEPYERVSAGILRKVRENGLRNVTLIPVGLGDADTELEFQAPTGVNSGIGTFAGHTLTQPGTIMLTLPIRRGDDAFRANGITRADILKIDVEGFESRAIAGLQTVLREDRPIILMEILGTNHSGFASADALRNATYPDGAIYEVGATSVSGPYVLKPFDFPTAAEVLIVPPEKRALLAHMLP